MSLLNQKKFDVIIIGAGIGGLSAAIHAACHGHKVVILEQNDYVGGKMGEYKQQGFRWDTGPSIITMIDVFDNIFRVAGKELNDYLTFIPLDPITRYFFQNGKVIDASSNLASMSKQIQELSPKAVEEYLAFLAYAACIHRITGNVFIYDKPPTLKSIFKVSPFDYLKIDPFRSVAGSVNNFVQSKYLRQILKRFTTYVGSNPYSAPATLNVIAHVELTGGAWYPMGGVYAIAKALSKLAQELGVDILTSTEVDEILVDDHRTKGVKTSTGEIFHSKVVIANVDVANVLSGLIGKSIISSRRLHRLTNSELSCSGFIMLLGIKGKSENLSHHNIFFSNHYEKEFSEIFSTRIPAQEPTIYVSITSKAEPKHAPPDHENWFLLVNTPSINDNVNWRLFSDEYSNQILNQLKKFGVDIQNRIVIKKIISPVDLEIITGARKGSLYGLSSNHPLSAFKRPHNQDPDISGLFYCGGTSHPGGGVPLVILSGRVAAGLADNYIETKS